MATKRTAATKRAAAASKGTEPVATGTEAAAKPVATGTLTILGAEVRHPVDHVEVFPAPKHVTTITFTSDEVASMCPVTGQPDLSRVEIVYEPRSWCVESKSLKLYLWRFREQAVFAEALAAEIAAEIVRSATPKQVTVTITQRPRGGLTLTAVAARTS